MKAVTQRSMTAWPGSERPREKLLELGPGALSDAELLGIFIRTGTAGKTALDLARGLIERHGNLVALLQAGAESLQSEPGLGPAKTAQILAGIELGRRFLGGRLATGQPLTSPGAVRSYLKACLGARGQEIFAVLFLDNRHRVIRFQELFYGTVDAAAVYPREVVRRALQLNAAAVILAHNHPSGVAEPSTADRHLTERLRDALGLVDVRVLDHFIVGDADPVSFAELGLL